MYTLKLEDGKYEVVLDDVNFTVFEVLRYGEPWRNLVGDKFIYSLISKIRELEEKEATPR